MQIFSDGFKVGCTWGNECVGNYITIPFPAKEDRKGVKKTFQLTCCESQEITEWH